MGIKVIAVCQDVHLWRDHTSASGLTDGGSCEYIALSHHSECLHSSGRSYVKVEVAVLGFPSWAFRPGLSVLMILMVSVDVKQQ